MMIPLGKELERLIHFNMENGSNDMSREEDAEYELGKYYFPVWVLPPHISLIDCHSSLKKAKNTKSWYHPLIKQREIIAFSVCTYHKFLNRWKVQHMEGPEIAAELNRALELVENLSWHKHDTPRLLEIPRFFILALWISGRTDEIILLEFPGILSGLEYHKVYAAADFFQLLADTVIDVG